MRNPHTDGINADYALVFRSEKVLVTLRFRNHPTYRNLVESVTKHVRINFSSVNLDKLIPLGKSDMNGTELTLVGRKPTSSKEIAQILESI